MTARSRGRGLFIVDNSVSGWTGLRYLNEWTGIAKAFDIATGYFEIGALLALDGNWQGRRYSPFDVYAKALQEFFRGHELTATEWDETRSKMFHQLDRYQQEAYWALMKIARRHGGAFLCDGVGLGKTFVGLMLIERLVLREGKRVVLFAPKAAREGVWEPHLRDWLSHIGGVGGGGDFSNLVVFNHTDLGRKGDFPERFRRITELADVVVIDEAHHFRNPGRRGDPGKDIQPSRYYRMFDLLDSAQCPKTLFMLTATPINNRLSDFRHMAELFTRRDEKCFARTVGVNHLNPHFNRMEKALRARVGKDGAGAAEHLEDAQDILVSDEIFRELVVQRSRAYARESQIQEHGEAAAFPTREDPQVAWYSVRKTYGVMLNLFEKAFARRNPLFTLPMYYPLHWYRGPDTDIDPLEEGRQKQVVGLIRTNFLRTAPAQVRAGQIVGCDVDDQARILSALDEAADLLLDLDRLADPPGTAQDEEAAPDQAVQGAGGIVERGVGGSPEVEVLERPSAGPDPPAGLGDDVAKFLGGQRSFGLMPLWDTRCPTIVALWDSSAELRSRTSPRA